MNHYRAAIILVLVFFLLGSAFVWSAFNVSAECNGIKMITPKNQFANIRRLPSTINSSVAYELKLGQYEQWDTIDGNGWYHLTEGGYVHRSVVVEECQPIATPTQSIVPTVIITDTRKEYHYVFPSACEITVILEELP